MLVKINGRSARGGARIAMGGAALGACSLLTALTGCSKSTADEVVEAPLEAEPQFLAQKYADHFLVGAAIDPTSMQTHAALLEQHFNSITAENDMKFESLQPTEGAFQFTMADSMVDFAESRGMKVRGHALVWHRQTPAWVFSDGAGGQATREQLFDRLRTHISTVVGRYRGRIYAWDVVNEAMMDDGEYRTGEEEREDQQSAWYRIAGPSYIAEAFRYAHEADPDAKLFYNEYYNYIPVKRQAIYQMLRQLLEEGVPVHGVGLQAHLSIEPSTVETSHGYYQHVSEMEQAIELYSSLGLEVHITELDMSLYVPGTTYTPDMFYTVDTFSDELEGKQAARYGDFFALFRKHSDVIRNVTFWGIADDNTWLSEFSSGRKDFPLLFDVNHAPKQAFERVMDF